MTDAPPQPRRRLAVVLFADVAGYTELSARDEESALAVVAELRGISEESTAASSGRVVKHLGDGVMAAFESVDDALGCAFLLRTRFDAAGAVQQAGVKLRIGIHLGEVTEAPDGDLYGDGVNTASRVQSLARPGDVAVSDAVHRQIRNRSGFTTLSIGTHEVKGLPEPIEVWAVAPQGMEVAPYTPPKPARRPSSSRAAAIGIGAAVVTFAGLGIVLASSAGTDTGDVEIPTSEQAGDPVASEQNLPSGTEEGAPSIDDPQAADVDAQTEVEAAAQPPAEPRAGAPAQQAPPTTEQSEPATTAAIPEERTRRLGNWTVVEGLDAESGSAAITVARQARIGDAIFGVRCLLDSRQVNAAVAWPREVSPDRFQYQLDRTDGQAPWVRGPDPRTSIFAGDLGTFVRDLIRARSLGVRAADTAGRPMQAGFELQGAARAMAELRRVCNLN